MVHTVVEGDVDPPVARFHATVYVSSASLGTRRRLVDGSWQHCADFGSKRRILQNALAAFHPSHHDPQDSLEGTEERALQAATAAHSPLAGPTVKLIWGEVRPHGAHLPAGPG